MSESLTERSRPHSTLVYTLVTLAVLIGVFTLIGIVSWAVTVWRSGQGARGVELLLMVSLLVGAMIAMSIIVVGIWISRRVCTLLERAETIDQRMALLAEQSLSRPSNHGEEFNQGGGVQDLQQHLTRIQEVILLPPEERARRFKVWQQRETQRHIEEISRYVQSRDFRRARAQVDKLAELVGSEADLVTRVRSDLSVAMEAARSNDLIAAQGRVKDLLALGRYAEAERIAQELAYQYPQGVEPMGLLGHVRRERTQFEQIHRKRMHEEIQQLVHHRKWQHAADAARQFIQTFPTGPDTEALRDELETLLANADIQERKEQELQYKRLLGDKKYWDALELARRIMADHPLSPQAQALRNQVPRLEELAHQQAKAG